MASFPHFKDPRFICIASCPLIFQLVSLYSSSALFHRRKRPGLHIKHKPSRLLRQPGPYNRRLPQHLQILPHAPLQIRHRPKASLLIDRAGRPLVDALPDARVRVVRRAAVGVVDDHDLLHADEAVKAGDGGQQRRDVAADVAQVEDVGGGGAQELEGLAAHVAAGDDDDGGGGEAEAGGFAQERFRFPGFGLFGVAGEELRDGGWSEGHGCERGVFS